MDERTVSATLSLNYIFGKTNYTRDAMMQRVEIYVVVLHFIYQTELPLENNDFFLNSEISWENNRK